MAKRKKPKRRPAQSVVGNVTGKPDGSENAKVLDSNINIHSNADSGLDALGIESPLVRRIVSFVLIGYLAIVLLGPLSNPIASESLTQPLAEMVSPVHRMLFLGHGYRFFGPDPGPGHLVVYRITSQGGDFLEGQFPDRDQNWPRLLYHRWFMLSETVYQEHALTPDTLSFKESSEELAAQARALRINGKFALAESKVQELSKFETRYQEARQRIELLVSSIAGHLMEVNDGKRIELFVQERNIPFSIQVLNGSKLSDEEFLSPLTKIGEFVRTADGVVQSIELPLLEDAPAESSQLETEALPLGETQQ